MSACAFFSPAFARSAIDARLAQIVATMDADVGIASVHLESGAGVSLNAGERFPLASTYKVAIGAYALHLADRQQLSLDTLLEISREQRSTSSVISSVLPHDGVRLSLFNLLELMLTHSDNTATDVILDAVGGSQAVTAWLRAAGIEDMRVDRSTAQILRQFAGLPEPEEPQSFFDQYAALRGEGAALAYALDGTSVYYRAYVEDPQDQGTPAAMTSLLAKLWRGELLSPASTSTLTGILGRSSEPARISRGLPEKTVLAHKTGTLAGTVNDAGVFDLPDGKGRVVISVYVKRARGGVEVFEPAIGRIARAIYDHFLDVQPAAPTSRLSYVNPCPFPWAGSIDMERVQCAYLSVPERHESSQGSTVQLPVVRIRSSAANPTPDPVVFLHGGPGAAPLESGRTIERFAQHPFARERDIILFNQRGSAQTWPALACESLRTSRVDIYADDVTLAQRDARVSAEALACLAQIRATGRDLAAYATNQSARDLRALREGLGVRTWNLLAVSYGTRLALETARIDAEGVRSLLLDSLVSPRSDLFLSESPRNFANGIDSILRACSLDSGCARAFPELDSQLEELLDRLETQPLVIDAAAPGGTIRVTVNWHDFLTSVHWMLYDAQALRLVPLLIDRTHRDDPSVLMHVIERIYPASRNGTASASPAFFAMVCNDAYASTPQSPDSGVRNFSIVTFMRQVCAPSAGESQQPLQALRADVPTLLLTGRFDPMTPRIYAREVAGDLDGSIEIEIANSGHSTLSDFTACQTQIASHFLDSLSAQDARLDCLQKIAPPAFALSMDELL